MPFNTVLDDKVDGRHVIIQKNEEQGHHTAYVSVEEGTPEYKVATQSRKDLPINVHGGLTFTGKNIKGAESPGDYYIGWDYAHAFSGDASLVEVMEDVQDVVSQLENASLKDAAKRRLEKSPKWFQEKISLEDEN